MTGAYVMIGTGRARCKICEMPIKKGQKAIKFWSYRVECQVHHDKKNCDRFRDKCPATASGRPMHYNK